MNYQPELALAIETVLRACDLCRTIQADLISEETALKSDDSPVTVADFSSQTIISMDLHHAFPGDAIVAEESADDLHQLENGTLKERVFHYVHSIYPDATEEGMLEALGRGNCKGGPNRRFWTIDPIDGTKGFLRGEQYAVALALIENGEVILGVLGCPNLPLKLDNPTGPKGCLYYAVKGGGAHTRKIDACRTHNVRVSNETDPSQATICMARDSGHSPEGLTQTVARQLKIEKPFLRLDSQCKYITLARGEASIYLRLTGKEGYKEKIWDHAPGWIILKEAGGECTDVFGEPLDFTQGQTLDANTGIVATNGRLHTQVIEHTQTVMSRM